MVKQDATAAGGGRDVRTRLLKTQIAAADADGDDDTAKRLRAEVDKLNDPFRTDLETAAASRRAAAAEDDTAKAQKTPPQGRQTPGKQTTS